MKEEKELSKVIERLNPMFEEYLEKQRMRINSIIRLIMEDD